MAEIAVRRFFIRVYFSNYKTNWQGFKGADRGLVDLVLRTFKF